MLEVKNLTVTYDHIVAVNGIDLLVKQGEITALIGPNGAGKTSTMMAVSGLVRPRSGRIALVGERIDTLSSDEIYQRGVVQVPEGRLIFSGMSVRENLLLGADSLGNRVYTERDLAEVLELFPVLTERINQPGGTLSGGQLQMLAIARGLMGRPKLLMLDEPSLGLAPNLVEELFVMIARLNTKGITILLVEQNVSKSLSVAKRAYLMEAGRIVGSGSAKKLRESARVEHSYLGTGAPAR